MHTTLENVQLLKHFKLLLILKYFNNSTFFNVVCISWKLKCWILLMQGVTLKFMKGYLCSVRNDVLKQSTMNPPLVSLESNYLLTLTLSTHIRLASI